MPLLNRMCHLFPGSIECWVRLDDTEGQFQHSAFMDSYQVLSHARLNAPVRDIAWAVTCPLGHTYLHTFSSLTCPSPQWRPLVSATPHTTPSHPQLFPCVPSAPWVYCHRFQPLPASRLSQDCELSKSVTGSQVLSTGSGP